MYPEVKELSVYAYYGVIPLSVYFEGDKSKVLVHLYTLPWKDVISKLILLGCDVLGGVRFPFELQVVLQGNKSKGISGAKISRLFVFVHEEKDLTRWWELRLREILNTEVHEIFKRSSLPLEFHKTHISLFFQCQNSSTERKRKISKGEFEVKLDFGADAIVSWKDNLELLLPMVIFLSEHFVPLFINAFEKTFPLYVKELVGRLSTHRESKYFKLKEVSVFLHWKGFGVPVTNSITSPSIPQSISWSSLSFYLPSHVVVSCLENSPECLVNALAAFGQLDPERNDETLLSTFYGLLSKLTITKLSVPRANCFLRLFL